MLPSMFKLKLSHRVDGKASAHAYTSFTCVPKSIQTTSLQLSSYWFEVIEDLIINGSFTNAHDLNNV